jgi:N-acetylmuramoyl-L-alanine amidase
MKKHTRPIDRVIIHCTATPPLRDVTITDLLTWHVTERGWSDVGYHTLITLAGECLPGRDEAFIGAHTKGQNDGSIGIAYAGGIGDSNQPEDTRNEAQKAAIIRELDRIALTYGATAPDGSMRIAVMGHRDFANKACPSFDTHTEYGDVWAVYP